MAIYALRGNDDEKWTTAIYNSLKNGEARFGWSYYDDSKNFTTDLNILKEKIRQGQALTDDEANCYQPFLFDIKCGDYIVFINIPQYGECTLAKVTKEYYYSKHTDLQYEWGYDGNHCLGIDTDSIYTFNRNCKKVHPYLSSRLKLRGRHWQIYAEKEFDVLIDCLKNNKDLVENKNSIDFLQAELFQKWQDIANIIQATHPGKKLEELVVEIFKKIPGVSSVKNNSSSWRSDNGADVIVKFRTGLLDFKDLTEEKTLVIQVKSYEGEHCSVQAVNDIKMAINKYDADYGMIFSTGIMTENLFHAVEKASMELKKTISLCMGKDVAQIFLKYCIDDVKY